MKQKKHSLLWEILSDEYPTNSYLFGTMHVKSKRVFSAFDQIVERIDTCDAFCVEVDMAESQSMQMREVMMLPHGVTIKSLLKPREFKRLARIFRQLDAPDLRQFIQLRPMNLINLLSSLIMKEETEHILDLSLYQYAKESGKRTFGIETKEEHLNILKKLNQEIEIKQLKSVIRNFPAFVNQHHKIMEYYTHGRIDKLYLQGKRSLGKWRKILLSDRNHKMAARLHALAQKEAVFCAVGAGHLYGKFGVLRLLKTHGAKLRPILLNYE